MDRIDSSPLSRRRFERTCGSCGEMNVLVARHEPSGWEIPDPWVCEHCGAVNRRTKSVAPRTLLAHQWALVCWVVLMLVGGIMVATQIAVDIAIFVVVTMAAMLIVWMWLWRRLREGSGDPDRYSLWDFLRETWD